MAIGMAYLYVHALLSHRQEGGNQQTRSSLVLGKIREQSNIERSRANFSTLVPIWKIV